jgi:hypothetical protein
VSISNWWERFPGLLDAELSALDDAGIEYRLDNEARAQRGVIRLLLKVSVEDEVLKLIATYPDLYPYFRFEVQAPDVALGRHQHPFGQTLCLIGRRTENWHVDDSLAAFVRERLPLTLETAREPNSEEAESSEEHQGEPFTDYYTYQSHAMLLVDGSWCLPAPGGQLVIGLSRAPSHPQLPRGAVLSVEDASGNEIAVADDRLRVPFDKTITGRWVRLPEPPHTNDGEAVLQAMVDVDSGLQRPNWQRPFQQKMDVVAAVFPEEVHWRTSADGWLFVIRRVVPLGEVAR